MKTRYKSFKCHVAAVGLPYHILNCFPITWRRSKTSSHVLANI